MCAEYFFAGDYLTAVVAKEDQDDSVRRRCALVQAIPFTTYSIVFRRNAIHQNAIAGATFTTPRWRRKLIFGGAKAGATSGAGSGVLGGVKSRATKGGKDSAASRGVYRALVGVMTRAEARV